MNDLDLATLAGWMQQAVPALGRPLSLAKFAGGQSNPTYCLEAEKGNAVLRRKPFGPLLPSAHAVEREYKLISALYPTGFPVAAPLALCEDSAVIGAPFYLMAFLDGRSFTDGSLPNVGAQERRPIYEAMVDTLAALHAIDPQAVGLGDFGKPGNYFARQVERWTKQYRASQTDDRPEMDRLIEWLPQTLPQQERTAIIHGDFRIDNLVYAAESERVLGVIDWELATLGDPLADFAYLAMNWILPADGGAGVAGIDLSSQAIPTLDEIVARYCNATGRSALPDLHWYFAYNLFRLAAILQGVKKRLMGGNASSATAAKMVEKIEPLARAAWDQAVRANSTKGTI